jgi:hypothetical protein
VRIGSGAGNVCVCKNAGIISFLAESENVDDDIFYVGRPDVRIFPGQSRIFRPCPVSRTGREMSRIFYKKICKKVSNFLGFDFLHFREFLKKKSARPVFLF